MRVKDRRGVEAQVSFTDTYMHENNKMGEHIQFALVWEVLVYKSGKSVDNSGCRFPSFSVISRHEEIEIKVEVVQDWQALHDPPPDQAGNLTFLHNPNVC